MSSIIAVTFIFIRRNLEADRSGAGDGRQGPPGDEGNRGVENAVMFGFFAVLVAAGIWLLGTMADIRKVQDCAAQERRNCATVEVPERAR